MWLLTLLIKYIKNYLIGDNVFQREIIHITFMCRPTLLHSQSNVLWSNFFTDYKYAWIQSFFICFWFIYLFYYYQHYPMKIVDLWNGGVPAAILGAGVSTSWRRWPQFYPELHGLPPGRCCRLGGPWVSLPNSPWVPPQCWLLLLWVDGTPAILGAGASTSWRRRPQFYPELHGLPPGRWCRLGAPWVSLPNSPTPMYIVHF